MLPTTMIRFSTSHTRNWKDQLFWGCYCIFIEHCAGCTPPIPIFFWNMFFQGGIQMLSWLGLLFVTKFKQFDEEITLIYCTCTFNWCNCLATVCFQMGPQMACMSGCIITLVASVWLFSTLHFQMCPQIACLNRCKIDCLLLHPPRNCCCSWVV